MRENNGLTAVKSAKNDKFYTQFVDIQRYSKRSKCVFRI